MGQPSNNGNSRRVGNRGAESGSKLPGTGGGAWESTKYKLGRAVITIFAGTKHHSK